MNLPSLCCSLPLAKRLKELGIKQGESLFIMRDDGGHVILNKKEDWDSNADFYISVFTASEIGEMLPHGYVSGMTVWADSEKKWVCNWYYVDSQEIAKKSAYKEEIPYNQPIFGQTEADARAKMLIYLLENRLIHLKEQGIV